MLRLRCQGRAVAQNWCGSKFRGSSESVLVFKTGLVSRRGVYLSSGTFEIALRMVSGGRSAIHVKKDYLAGAMQYVNGDGRVQLTITKP